MKHLLLPMVVLAAALAFLMAFAATVQILGIQGKIATSQFILGPSWKWVLFDVATFVWCVGIVAGCFYGWMTQ